MRHGSHVWLDSVWMPTLSYETAKRAFHEWLDVMPSSRIMWGADAQSCRGDLRRHRDDSPLPGRGPRRADRPGRPSRGARLRIGRQILRENALALFPQLENRLWKHKGVRMKPPDAVAAPATKPR